MSTKLYVGNLPFETTEADLQSLFEAVRTGSIGSTSFAIAPRARPAGSRSSR